MQYQAVTGPAEQSTAKKNLRAQRGWLAIRTKATGALEFPKHIEQQQDTAKGRLGDKKLLQAKIIGGQIVFQFGDVIFHLRPAVVVSPELFRRQRHVADEDPKGVAGNIEQFSSQRGALGTQMRNENIPSISQLSSEPVKWLVDQMLPYGGLSIYCGKQGGMKSLFAMFLSKSVSSAKVLGLQ